MSKSSSSSLVVDPALAGLEPAAMWRYFGDLCRIPHESGNEAGVCAYAQSFAAERGYECEVNAVGDVLLRVNTSKPGPVVALQAHMDMVCVSRDGAPFDFATQAIALKRDGDTIHADGTSLGADNGIGVAYALALAELASGPLEVLLTVDEEQSFKGIEGVAPGWLRAKALINLDSEEEGFLTIASAGARDFIIRLAQERETQSPSVESLELSLDGLKGGHSGVEIHRGRTNALKAMARVLREVVDHGGVVYGMRGGTAPNVIPSSAKASIGLPSEKMDAFRKRLEQLRGQLQTEEDPVVNLELSSTTQTGAPLRLSCLEKLLGLIEQIPSGVLVASKLDPSQPFVSNNLAMVRALDDGEIELKLMSRSPSREELEKLVGQYEAIALANGGKIAFGKLVPGWAPDYKSPLLALFLRKYKEQSGKDGKVFEIHAGLECGALQEKYPGMDLISVGPDITDVHSPDEKVSVSSALRVFELVRDVIDEIHKGR